MFHYLQPFRHFSSLISTIIKSSPIFFIQSKGITNSQSLPKIPQNLVCSGTTSACMQPSHRSNTKSSTHPSRLQVHKLITSFSRSSQSLILSPFLLLIIQYMQNNLFLLFLGLFFSIFLLYYH